MTATWLLFAIGLLTAAGEAMAVEKLSYRTIEQDGDVELRRIEPHVVAETFVEGDFEHVGNEGFRSLVEYPQPTDERIRLRGVPARTVAAIRYTGFWSRSRYDVHEQRLREWIQRRGLESVGEPVWARYDPPFMPWFLRPNEILIELRSDADT